MRRILSIDGGGIRGIIPASLLVALGPQSFDMVAGTSTGGIIATGLAAGIPASEVLDIYVKHGGEVFADGSPGILSSKYSPDALVRNLKAVFGQARLSQPFKSELLVPSYAVHLATPEDQDRDGVTEGAASWFFRSWRARQDPASDAFLWEVCRATSAAPTYFPPASVNGNLYVDGGVFANNPAMCALAAATNLWPGEELRVLSLGTGTSVNGISAGNWGAAQWLTNIASVFMDGAADAVSYQMEAMMGQNFLRCDTALVGVNGAFDDASPGNIANLENLAVAFTAKFTDTIKAFLA